MFASDYLQGMRGNTGDYGNIGETGPKVSADFLFVSYSLVLFIHIRIVLTQLYILRVKQEARVKRECKDPGGKW